MRRLIPPMVLVAVWGFTLAVVGRLPERIATHWNLFGEPNGWSSRVTGAILFPAIITVMFVLFTWLPRPRAREGNQEQLHEAYDVLVVATLVALGAIHVAVLGAALGWPISVARTVPVAVGLLFIVVGSVLPRARRSWLVGIRTPWALSSDRVWERTHRVGGALLAVGGVCIAASALVDGPWSLVLTLGGVFGFSLATIAYSYWVWRRDAVQDEGGRLRNEP